MEPSRQQAYQALIQQLVNCPSGEELTILEAHADLLDSGFVAMCQQVSQSMEGQNQDKDADWLRSFAEWLDTFTGVYILLYNSGTDNEGIHTIDYPNRSQVLLFEDESAAIEYAERLEGNGFPRPSVELIARIEAEDICRNEGYEPRFVPPNFTPLHEDDYSVVQPPARNADICPSRIVTQLAPAMKPMEWQQNNTAHPTHGERMASYNLS